MSDAPTEPARTSRRPPHEVRVLEKRVLDALRTRPGATRLEIAYRLDCHPVAVGRPITNLLHAAQLRRVGHKEKATYWPADNL